MTHAKSFPHYLVLLLASLVLAFASLRAQAADTPAIEKEDAQAKAAFFLADPTPAWVIPAAIPASKSTDPRVYLLADTQLQGDEHPAYYVHRAEQINSATELENAGRLEIDFIPEYQQLHLHSLRIVRDGKVLDRTQTAHIRFLQREAGLEQEEMYSGTDTASILINDLRVGDTLEYSYTIAGQNPVFGGKFVENASWGDSAPIVWRRVVLRTPQARPVNWRYLSDNAIPAPRPVETNADGWRTLLFEAHDLPGLRNEGELPPDYVLAGSLQFTAFADWQAVALWADKLFTVNEPLGPDLQPVLARLKALPTPEQQVVAALEVAQTDIRYFSIALGESSHRPAPPNVVYQRRYGDCKDKALFLHSLLNELGIASTPVLLDAISKPLPQRMLPSPYAFNHAILQATVNGKIWYLDPTRHGQHGLLANMSQPYGNAQVLLVSKTATALTRIPPDTRAMVDVQRDEVVSLPDFDGTALLTVTEIWRGENAEDMRTGAASASSSDMLQFVTDPVSLRYPKATLEGTPVSSDDPLHNEYTLVAHFKVPAMAEGAGSNWRVPFDASNFVHTFSRLASPVRSMPFHVADFPLHLRYSFIATLPSQVAGQQDAVATALHRKLFNYDATFSMRGNTVREVEDLQVLAEQGKAEDAPGFINDLRDLGNQTRDAAVITPADMADSKAASADLIQTQITQRSERMVENISKVIAAGQLSSDDLAAAYCFRGTARYALGQSKGASDDLALAQKLGPDAAVAVHCRAEFNFANGDFAEVIANRSEEISLGGTEPRLYYSRAVAQLLNGNGPAALADVNRALTLDNGMVDPYDQIWAAWILKRQHQPLPAALEGRVNAGQDWPAPVLALFAGKAQPEQVLKAAARRSGLEGRMASTEANFYVGEYYLAQGDTAQARAAFEQSRKLGVTNFYEYGLAGVELQKLDGLALTSSAPML